MIFRQVLERKDANSTIIVKYGDYYKEKKNYKISIIIKIYDGGCLTKKKGGKGDSPDGNGAEVIENCVPDGGQKFCHIHHCAVVAGHSEDKQNGQCLLKKNKKIKIK